MQSAILMLRNRVFLAQLRCETLIFLSLTDPLPRMPDCPSLRVKSRGHKVGINSARMMYFVSKIDR